MFGRSLLVILFCGLCSVAKVHAQQWARDMFVVTSHDFGSVARASDPEFRFEFENKYKEDVHIASVRSSCGCTSPSFDKALLKSREKGAITAKLNTVSFVGDKSAVVTVVFDKPFYAEVQLIVKGQIRSDVTFEPNEIDFGRLTEGTPKEVTVQVNHSGRSSWAITDVQSPFDHVRVQLSEPSKSGAKVSYTMKVTVTETAPTGPVQQHLTVVTNDGTGNRINVPLVGEVTLSLSVTPSNVNFGSVKPGETVKKRIVVKGPQPFSITKVATEDPRITCAVPEGKKPLHLLDIEFKAGEEAGKLQETVRIETDMDGGRTAPCVLIAEVAQP